MKKPNIHTSPFILALFVFMHLDTHANTTDMVILNESSVKNLKIKTEVAEERDFETTTFAIGRIEAIPANHSVLSSRIAGRIVSLNAFEGDYVEAGQVIARVESRQLGNPPPTIDLKSVQSGLVISSHIQLGQPVEPNIELMDISDRSQMWAVAQIPEKEAIHIRHGTQAYIRIPAVNNESIEAPLLRFGVDADRESGAIQGIFQLDNSSGLLRPGMRAEFSIILEQRSNVLTIPYEAIQGDSVRRVVFIKDFELPNAFTRSPVVLGEVNNDFVEIISGIFPGDEVVTRGSYSLNFVGKGSSLSLKEALDAAHGHEHNEDGSEITEEQKKHKHNSIETHHDHHAFNKFLIGYAILVTLLLVITMRRLLSNGQLGEPALPTNEKDNY